MAEIHNRALSPERQAFRERFNLRELTPEESGRPIERLPEGVYGFSCAPSTSELPLFAKPIFRCFEIHKLVGGEIAWVGYLSEAEASLIEAGQEPVTVDLYPEPYESAIRLVSIPSARIDRRRPPTRDFGNALKVDIGPRPEFLEMTGVED
jgi:hypothetical protein